MTMEIKQRTVGVILFPGFELLDVFGPLEAFGMVPDRFKLAIVAEKAGPVRERARPQALAEYGLADCPHLDLILVPGGIGTREGVNDAAFLKSIRELSDQV